MVERLTAEEWNDVIDAAARRRLGMSGEEFQRMWRAGDFDGLEHPDYDHCDIWSVGILMGDQ